MLARNDSGSRFFVGCALLVAVGATSACRSDQERCRAAVASAKTAWTGYLASLEKVKQTLAAEHASAKTKLTELEPTIAERARQKADSLNRKGESAWYRTFDAARQALCAEDQACSELRGTLLQTEAMLQEIDGRMAAAKKLLGSLAVPPGRLPAVEDDFDRRDALRAARESSAGATEACAALAK